MSTVLLTGAGVIVAIALFTLLGFVVWVLRTSPRLPAALTALGGVLIALPAIITAVYWFV